METLQRDYKINIAGPSTMAALLNSLQMGFRTLAIQKHSSKVWDVLGAVKTEFDKFGSVLEATQKRINQANAELDKLIGTRTRMIRSKLRSVTALPEESSQEILGIEEELEDLPDREGRGTVMNIFAIGDLHLSTDGAKPMDIYGGQWIRHAERLEQKWRSVVEEDDIVIVAGDISWAMKRQDATEDLEWIARLPGKKC